MQEKIRWVIRKQIEPYQFAYFDDKKYILYISDHKDGIYKLDGETIELIDNGSEGIFFEFNSSYTPFNIDVKNLEGINYFEREKLTEEKSVKLTKEFPPIKLRGEKKWLGFNWDDFYTEDSYLYKYLIGRTNFGETEDLTVGDQMYLLTLYFYSLFFENMLIEKPIICFVGFKHSGKSFIGETIGKILFGDRYHIYHTPNTVRNVKTLLATSYYLAFDNLDRTVEPEIIDALCVAATGGTIKQRKLYTDKDIVEFTPRVYLLVTTREARFKRDDFVSRLLIFNTEKIEKTLSRGHLFKTLGKDRDNIMSEVLINLNTIINILKRSEKFNPAGVSRLADFELFCKKLSRGFVEGFTIRDIFDKMGKTKDRFTLEDDPMFIILKNIVVDTRNPIEELSANELYLVLEAEAENLRVADFKRRYKNPVSLGKRLRNIKDELNTVMKFESLTVRSRQKKYWFYPLDWEPEKKVEQRQIPDEMDS